jgi:hypothetical protein
VTPATTNLITAMATLAAMAPKTAMRDSAMVRSPVPADGGRPPR